MSSKLTGRRLAIGSIVVIALFLGQQTHADEVDSAQKKIDPDLLSDVQRAMAGEQVQSALGWTQIQVASTSKDLIFVARIRAGANLGQYSNRWFARPFNNPDGTTVASGIATPEGIMAMAADPAVISLQRATSQVNSPKPPDPELAAMTQARLRPQIPTQPGPGPAPQGWFHTGSAIHGSRQAWDKGYTGDGVRHMVNDSGADYCHPDLHGTWAYIDDPASPYYGLPEMFDSISAYQAAFDFFLGTTFVADGLTDYADTSRTANGPFAYTPIGAALPHSYTVPGTSKSGVYHYGSHPDKALAANAAILSGAFGDGTAVAGERAAVLVVDAKTAGVYDTVYVDIDYDFVFEANEVATLNRDFAYGETACLDFNGDDLNDVSGGLVYFISDGQTAVPTLDWFWGIPGSAYGNGNLVAFHVMDYLEGGGDHGMGCTSVAAGQGIVRGSLFVGPNGPPAANGQGLVVGPGKNVGTTQNGNFYVSPFSEDGFIFAALGYDGVSGTSDDVQIVSASWGSSDVDNEGFDAQSRLFDDINRRLGPNMSILASTGNGAPGYGTVAPPSPSTGIGIGASTLYGTLGLFETIASEAQITGGDVMTWSNRGPGVRNIVGADVVATGAFGTGSVSLNQVLDGSIATANFGGTSMAAPVAAGNLALIYQAFRTKHDRWPTFKEAKELLMSSATNINHDVWSQGAGLVNADTGTDVAAGKVGVYASPSEWSVGDYRGTEYEAFAHIIGPGESDTQTFTLTNHSNRPLRVRIKGVTLRRIGERYYSFKSIDQSLEHGDFLTPDYAIRLDNDIPAGTELVEVRVTNIHNQFDPDENLSEPFSNWRIHLQNWTDLDNDGRFWEDTDNDGKIDVGEMDANEHIRFNYTSNTSPNHQVRMSNPLERMDNGILLTLRHRERIAAVPQTDLNVGATFWRNQRWQWVRTPRSVRVPANGTATFQATIRVPRNTQYGMYEGAIMATYGDNEVVIPVTVSVAASGPNFAFGGTNRRSQQHLYDNGAVNGYTDYNWRAESGDWRFYYFDVNSSDGNNGATPYVVVRNEWRVMGTDIDTIVLGPVVDGATPESVFGPYTLGIVGRSANTYIGSGRWPFQTSSGGTVELISARAQPGLHAILLHQVRADGRNAKDEFSGFVGTFNIGPERIAASGSGTAEITVDGGLRFNQFGAQGFGLSRIETTTGAPIQQDDPNDPLSASFVRTVTLSNAVRLDVTTGNSANGSDLDLFVYGPNGDLLGSSTTPTDEESISLTFPADGTYTIRVQGWSVPAGTDTFDYTQLALQGNDIVVTQQPRSIRPGRTERVGISWDTTGKAPGVYVGALILGPPEAPALFQVPLEITVP